MEIGRVKGFGPRDQSLLRRCASSYAEASSYAAYFAEATKAKKASADKMAD
jgi:hypothetical protein